MEVDVRDGAVKITGRDVTVVMNDDGGAHVSLVLAIGRMPPIEHDETYQGSKWVLLTLKKGTYPCKVMFAAYKYKALGPTYDATIAINRKIVASARGEIARGEWSDFGYGSFTLTVA